MKSLSELAAPYESVSFIGMYKNVGKTTAFNRLIAELRKQKLTCAVTSIGRDGESTDLVTDTVKPGIFVYKGTLAATSADLLKYCDITREILRTTGIYTPLGEIVIFRALSDGFVQLAGPSMTAQFTEMSGDFRRFGAQKILVDGALSRKSLCTKRVSQSTILCTGASYHRDIDRVVWDTAFTCRLLSLPQTNLKVGGQIWNQKEYKYIPVWDPADIRLPQEKQTPEVFWRRGAPDAPRRVIVQGGLTDAMVKGLVMSNADLQGKTMVLRDGSKILLSYDMYDKLLRKGLSFEVLDAIKLLAVTINPFSPDGYPFEKNEFKQRMSEAVNVPVYNVRES